MSIPNLLDQEETKANTSETSFKPLRIEYVSEKPRKPKAEIVTLENTASKFPYFIMPSIQKENFVKEVQKYPSIEENLFASNSSGYILNLEKSTNPVE